MPVLFKLGVVLCVVIAFILGCVFSTWVITGIKLQGTIVIDTEHYSKPAHLFKFNKPLSAILGNKYVMFEVQVDDLRTVFGEEKKLNFDEEA